MTTPQDLVHENIAAMQMCQADIADETVKASPLTPLDKLIIHRTLARASGDLNQPIIDSIAWLKSNPVPTPPSPVPPSPTPGPIPSPGMLPLPSGYAASDVKYTDDFTKPRTDLWHPWYGTSQFGTPGWNDQGRLQPPLTGGNQGGFNDEYCDPSQLEYTPNGLIIHINPSSAQPGYLAKTGSLSSDGLQNLSCGPEGYMLLRTLMQAADISGPWSCDWLVPGPNPEWDIQESGNAGGKFPGKSIVASHYFGVGGGVQQIDTGIDLTQSMNLYEAEITPNGMFTYFSPGPTGQRVHVGTWAGPAPKSGWIKMINQQVASAQANWKQSAYNGRDLGEMKVGRYEVYVR